MFREGDPNPEDTRISPESEKEREMRQLARRIGEIPDPFDTLRARVHAEVLKHLEENGTAEEKELWILYDGNRAILRSELYSKSGDFIQLKQPNGETISASKQDIQEIEDLRNQLTGKLRPSVYAELEKAPFVSSRNPEMRANWQRCPECRKPIKPQWRMIIKNDKEHPLKVEEIGPYWNQSIAMGQKTIPQDYRFISYPELHQLEEHPSKSDVSLEDWQAFLGNE